MRIGEVIRSKELELASLFLGRICGTMPQSRTWKPSLRPQLRRWLRTVDNVRTIIKKQTDYIYIPELSPQT